MLQIRIDMVNQKQFKESEVYKEIKILIPRDEKNLRRDFEYLDLDYNYVLQQDIHIRNCEIIENEETDFSRSMTEIVNRIIAYAEKNEDTVSFNNINQLYKSIKTLDGYDRKKLLLIIETKAQEITDIKDIIKYSKNIDYFELIDVESKEEYARKLIEDAEVDIDDIIDYVDLECMAEDYISMRNGEFTRQGVLVQNCEYIPDVKEEEEEFE